MLLNSTLAPRTTLSPSPMNANNSNCNYDKAEDLQIKFPLVVLFGTSVAVLSFLENVFLFFNLILRRRLRQSSYMFYLTLVVFVDLFISVSYVVIMTIQVLYDYLPSLPLYNAWMAYMRPLLTVSTVSLVCSAYLIVAWTFERFVTTVYPGQLVYDQKGRWTAAFIAIVMGLLARGTTFAEMEITYHLNCVGFERISIHGSPLAGNVRYRTIWMFWGRNILTVIFPFAALAYMNIAIVMILKRQYRNQQYAGMYAGLMAGRLSTFNTLDVNSGTSFDLNEIGEGAKTGGVDETEMKRSYKDATFTTIGIVNVYILATVMDVVVASWELIDRNGLETNWGHLYSTLSDVTSIAKVFCGTLRMPTALLCNSLIRQEIGKTMAWLCCLSRFCRSRRGRSPSADGNDGGRRCRPTGSDGGSHQLMCTGGSGGGVTGNSSNKSSETHYCSDGNTTTTTGGGNGVGGRGGGGDWNLAGTEPRDHIWRKTEEETATTNNNNNSTAAEPSLILPLLIDETQNHYDNHNRSHCNNNDQTDVKNDQHSSQRCPVTLKSAIKGQRDRNEEVEEKEEEEPLSSFAETASFISTEDTAVLLSDDLVTGKSTTAAGVSLLNNGDAAGKNKRRKISVLSESEQNEQQAPMAPMEVKKKDSVCSLTRLNSNTTVTEVSSCSSSTTIPSSTTATTTTLTVKPSLNNNNDPSPTTIGPNHRSLLVQQTSASSARWQQQKQHKASLAVVEMPIYTTKSTLV